MNLHACACRLATITALVFVLPLGLAHGQAAGCDEGVIRLPDRSGTIQICSAISAKLPQLERQLQEATKGMAAQRSQIAELTRLIKGMNTVSRQVGVDRQTQMLESLVRDLLRADRQGEDKLTRTVSLMVDGIDDLQGQMLGMVGKQGGQAALTNALRGPVGESISRLEFGTASRQLDDINRRLQVIEERLSDVKADTGQLVQQVGRVESVLGEMAANFSALSRAAALIPNPRSPEEFYSNAVQYETRGDMVNARASYRRYFESGARHFDPVERFVRLVTATEGRAGAQETLRGLNRSNPSPVVDAYLRALDTPAVAASALGDLIRQQAGIGPLHYLLARQYSEERLGQRSLNDQQREREALAAFVASHARGEVIRFFIDQRMAADWLAGAEASLKRSAGIERVGAKLLVTSSNAGWQLRLQANEPVRRVFYRMAPGGALADLGQSDGIDPETRAPAATTYFQLPRGTDLSKIEVFFDDLSRVRRGPVTLPPELADPARALGLQHKRTLEMTSTSWVAFRADRPIVYFTHLASMRCGIRSVRWGWGDELDRTLAFPPCNVEQPFSVPSDSNAFMVRFDPATLPSNRLSVDLVFFDGTRSGVKSFAIEAGMLESLRRGAERTR